ncbi:o-succinylbenzoate synthase [uncultured Eudoraea sp.]|uniref:o-succinylbenzoate synthase n=1 Tax=uncultured Eudoraea sp. TaxID=1035614 RepID=UPI0026033072|nr:o-succinylbenzoate synthase [uncultured Eudoraea sp.]
MKAFYRKYHLKFKRPAGTSRGVLMDKETWFLILKDQGKSGIGECGLFRGLSMDDVPEYEEALSWTCSNIHLGPVRLLEKLKDYPSIKFGVEQAFASLQSEDPFILFPSDFTRSKQGININGLIWMGDAAFMQEQIEQKISSEFNCIKTKIGAIDFDTELSLFATIRKKYSKEEIQLRVDANGAFSPEEAIDKLQRLAEYDIHSIEQPIKQGFPLKMKQLCENTPLPIALDEELIGHNSVTEKESLLQTIRPYYIILKPSLLGGFSACKEWIEVASKLDIGWWITSALESNIGLNAIAQWTYTLNNKMAQGLGTGSLFTNNFPSPLEICKGQLHYNKNSDWEENLIDKLCI